MFKQFASLSAFVEFLDSPHSCAQNQIETRIIGRYVLGPGEEVERNILLGIPEKLEQPKSVKGTAVQILRKHLPEPAKKVLRKIRKIGRIGSPQQGHHPELVGFCVVCNHVSSLNTIFNLPFDMHVNYRERLACEICGLNNRQRLMMAYIMEQLSINNDLLIYAMEQTTPFFRELNKKSENVIGSEYLGDKRQPGAIINGIRHEDCLNLSYKNESIDMIVSNDVFEHITDVHLTFSEMHRVLRPGGILAFTIPSDVRAKKTLKRAGIENSKIVHYEKPVYHGNPMSPDGSLVFYDYGQDIFDFLRQAGFSYSEVVCSDDYTYGHYSRPWLIAAHK